MTDRPYQGLDPQKAAERVAASIHLRKRKETRFVWLGKTAVAIALGFLVLLFAGILSKGIPGLFQYYVTLDLELDAQQLDPSGQMTAESLAEGDFDGVIRSSLYQALGNPEGRKAKREARRLISSGSSQRLMNYVLDHPDQLGSTVSIQFAVDDDVDTFLRGLISRDTPEADRRISDQLIDYIDALTAQGRVSYQISDYLFFSGLPLVMLKWLVFAARLLDRS